MKKGNVWNGNLINTKKDGTLFEEQATISPVKDGYGKIINYVAIKRNITEKKRLEALAETTNLMHNLGYIFSGIRHEIGNPVNSIKMALTVLIRNIDTYSRERILEFVQRAFNEISRVEYLLKALKNMSMYEHLEIQYIRMDLFMKDFLPLVQKDFKEKGILINMILPYVVESAYTDPRALYQVLLNILTNSADALENREAPQITIKMSREKNMLQIRVDDNGCGLSHDELESAFEPFFTTKPHGTGIGLMIVKKTLSKMNSTIILESSKNIGTIVTISLPMRSIAKSEWEKNPGNP